MRVVNPSSKSKWLEARVSIERDVAPFVIVHSLHNGFINGVDHQSRTAQMIADDAVGDAVPDHITRYIGFFRIHKPTHNLAAAVQFGDGVERVLVEESLCEQAVDFFANAPILGIDDIVNEHITRQGHLHQVTEDVVVIMGGYTCLGFTLQVTIGGVTVRGVVVADQAILGIVLGDSSSLM